VLLAFYDVEADAVFDVVKVIFDARVVLAGWEVVESEVAVFVGFYF
jgi:hypothetical protein